MLMVRPVLPQVNITLSNGLTAVLLLLTAWYAYQTRKQAKEMEKTRKAEKERRDERLIRQKRILRKTLKSEIELLDEHHDVKTANGRRASALRRASSTAVYEGNTDKLGLLSQDEIDAVVDFYTDVALLEELYQDDETKKDDLDGRSKKLLSKQRKALKTLNSGLDQQSNPNPVDA